jgi:hypothetical protein
MPVRDAVDPVEVHLRDPGEQLDERYAGIVGVVVGPFRGVQGNERATLFDEVRPPAVVQDGKRERHLLRPPRA